MKRTKPTQTDRWRELGVALFSTKPFLSVNKRALGEYGPIMAVFVANLVDRFLYFQEQGTLQSDGSFFLTNEAQMKQIGTTEYTVKKCKKELKGMGVIFLEMRGMPPKEFIIINWELMVKTFLGDVHSLGQDSYPTMGQDSPPTLGQDSTPIYIESRETLSKETVYTPSQVPDDNDTIEKRNADMVPLAERLATIVQSNKNIRINKDKIKRWANDIRKLHEVEEVPIERIEAALDWYEDNIGGEYVPVIESGSALRDKFIKLENAVGRSTSKKNSRREEEDPYDIIEDEFNSKDMRKRFIGGCFEPASALLNGVNQADLADKLIDLYADLNRIQDKKLSPKLQELLPGPIDLIEEYMKWIEDNHWIQNRDIKLFDTDHKLFGKFRREQASRDNKERDPLTGQSYMRE